MYLQEMQANSIILTWVRELHVDFVRAKKVFVMLECRSTIQLLDRVLPKIIIRNLVGWYYDNKRILLMLPSIYTCKQGLIYTRSVSVVRTLDILTM